MLFLQEDQNNYFIHFKMFSKLTLDPPKNTIIYANFQKPGESPKHTSVFCKMTSQPPNGARRATFVPGIFLWGVGGGGGGHATSF